MQPVDISVQLPHLSISEVRQIREACTLEIIHQLRRIPLCPLAIPVELLREIKLALKQQGKSWWTFDTDHPQWGEEGCLMYYLHPKDTGKYNDGLFTVDDLIAWLLDEGPVMKAAITAKE